MAREVLDGSVKRGDRLNLELAERSVEVSVRSVEVLRGTVDASPGQGVAILLESPAPRVIPLGTIVCAAR